MTTPSNAILLYVEQKGLCRYCGASILDEIKSGRSIHVDHKNPKVKGGNSTKSNLCLSCSWCNSAKKDKTEIEFLKYVEPILAGKVDKKRVSDYWKYKVLEKQFSGK